MPVNFHFSLIKTADQTFDPAEFKFAYGNWNKQWNTYRAIFLNYPIEQDSDFKMMKGDEKKLVVALIGGPNTEDFQPGVYNFSIMKEGAFSEGFTVTLMTASKVFGAASGNQAAIGKVEVSQANDEKFSGKVDLHDSFGFEVVGAFEVDNHDSGF